MWDNAQIRDAASEIAVLCDLEGGHLPGSQDEFWAVLATQRGVQGELSISELASSVLTSLGIEADDDHFGSEDRSPSLSAYEAILSTLKSQVVSGAVDSGEADEEEGDDEAAEFSGIMADVAPVNSTIRELMIQVNEADLVLNPEWQRGFVWKLQKQRRLIESILLGLPIPSFLFYTDSTTGRSFVIDGRQRLETISRFMAPKEERGDPKVRFRTFNAKTPGWTPGSPLNPAANKYFSDLPAPLKQKFQKSALVTFTFKDIPADQLYQIFKRYNTGAVALNAAEIRNAVYQASLLHAMMFRMGGEHRSPERYLDAEERNVGETLRATIPRGKLERYGAYDFIGRFFAFRYMQTGSVAAATNSFMQKHGKDAASVEKLRRQFIDAFKRTLEWYEFPLVEPKESGSFHAMLAAIQLVSTSHALDAIRDGEISEDQVRKNIVTGWKAFCEKKLAEKQNSTLFWQAHGEWNGIVLGK